jgi:SOS-response transcriptional repressor LexA
MLTKNQIEVLNLFRKDIFQKSSILEIKNKINKTSYARIHESISILKEKNILKIEKIGHTSLVFTDLNPQFIIQASYLDEDEAMNLNISNYEKIINIKEISDYLIIIKNQEKSILKRTTELELTIIIPNSERTLQIQEIVEKALFLTNLKINILILKEKEFIEMILENKEIFKSRIILKNACKYYYLLKEAIKQGLK